MGRAEDEDPFGMARPKAPVAHEIGQPLETLSVAELEERVALLHAEIARLQAVRDSKEASRKAADSFFKS
jgi:uncharacterized small protein (DUF1192 family)